MRVAVDAMGGDRAPRINVEGALEAAAKLRGHEIILVGDEQKLKDELRTAGGSGNPSIRIVHASQVVEMGESPVAALRGKRDSSMAKAVQLVKDGQADAFLSAGNTGATVAAAVLAMRLLPGVRKPGIAVPLPTRTGRPCLVIDVGANIYCKPEHLFQYGIMASVYSQKILGTANPRVGILNIGEEEEKGIELVKQTMRLLQSSRVNFIGNVEGRDIFKGNCDVIVCEGFVGNVVLKTTEGVAETLMSLLKEALTRNWKRKLGALLSRNAFREVRRVIDYSEYGGAPLLGVNGICIICHGGSNGHAIANAIRVAIEHSNYEVNDLIVSEVKAGLEASSLPADSSPR